MVELGDIIAIRVLKVSEKIDQFRCGPIRHLEE